MEIFLQWEAYECFSVLVPWKSQNCTERMLLKMMCGTFNCNPWTTISSYNGPITASDNMITFYNELSSLVRQIVTLRHAIVTPPDQIEKYNTMTPDGKYGEPREMLVWSSLTTRHYLEYQQVSHSLRCTKRLRCYQYKRIYFDCLQFLFFVPALNAPLWLICRKTKQKQKKNVFNFQAVIKSLKKETGRKIYCYT